MRKVFWVFFAIMALSAAGLAYYYFQVYQPKVRDLVKRNVHLPDEQEKMYFYLPTGSTFTTLMDSLSKNKLLKDTASFLRVATRLGFTEVHPGRYEIMDKMTNYRFITMLQAGNQKPLNLKIQHIWFSTDLASIVGNNLEGDSAEIVALMSSDTFLAKYDLTPENALALIVANTYEFQWNTSAQQVLLRLGKERDKIWTEERLAKAKAMDMSVPEVMSLAAIVAGETVKVDESPMIAGLYLNRLEKGWKLQSDPTLVYLIKSRDRKADVRRVKFWMVPEDLRESPYHTYNNKGLPPGPIKAPEPWAIDAVLDHATHDYMFMVASLERRGYHDFNETAGGHSAAADKYRKHLTEQGIH